MQEEALFSYSTQREIPSSLSRLERRRDSLHATQGGPETPSQLEMKPDFPPQLKKSPIFPTSSGEEGPFPALTQEESHFPAHHKRRTVSPIETRVEPRITCCKEKGHRVPPQLKIRPDSPPPTRMEPRVTPHNINGGLTWLLNLQRKHKFSTSTRQEAWHPFTTREKSGFPCFNKR